MTGTIDALGGTTTILYDGDGNVTAVIDARGEETDYLYNAMNRVTQTNLPGSITTYKSYTDTGKVATQTDGNGNVTTFLYDSLDRATVTIDAGSNRTTSFYDAAGNLTGIENARGYTTQFVYDQDNRLTVTIDNAGNRTTQILDAAGNTTVVIDALNNRTSFLFDALNRATVTIDANNHRSTSYHDAAGNLTGVSDGNSNLTQHLFDALNRGTVTIDSRNNRTTSLLDAAGNLTSLTDADNYTTTFAYDALNRKTSETDSLGHTSTFAYNQVGMLTSTTDRIGQRIDYSYDDAGRMVTETWFNSSGTQVAQLTFTYDNNNNMLTASNSDSSYQFKYDALNRVTSVNDTLRSNVLTMSYDEVGNRTKVEDNQGGVTTSLYDADNRMTSQQFGGSGQTPLRVDLSYLATGQLQGENRYSDLSASTLVAYSTFLYDAVGNMTGQRDFQGGGTSINTFTMTYDSGNRITTENRNGTTVTYTYDSTNEVTGDGTNTFTFDGTGNRTNTGYSTGPDNQVLNDGVYTYTYDNNGNLTEKSKGSSAETWTYGYNNQNQMIWAEQRAAPGGTLEMRADYKYDALGNRAESDVTTYVGGVGTTVTTKFALDGWQTHIDAMGRPEPLVGLENWNDWADLKSDNSLQTRYVRGDAIDSLFARIGSDGSAYWLVTDRMDSIRNVLDGSGAAVDTINYDANGNITYESVPTYGGRNKWTGQETDVETGLQYNRARYYNLNTGTWTSQDPESFTAGDSNLYRFVQNDPLNYIDPTGLWTVGILYSVSICHSINKPAFFWICRFPCWLFGPTRLVFGI